MMRTRIALIGGTGLEEAFREGKRTRIGTPYGPSPIIKIVSVGTKDIAFIPRHGEKHTIPPHMINYRANIWALHMMGVERILSSNAVGAINPEIKTEDMVVPSDFIDFTRLRANTFYDEPPVTHINASNVYCPELRRFLCENAKQDGKSAHEKGTYLCTEGPRYESPAEIRMFKSWGCDVVGMTGLPEAVLAHELGMCYASLCYVTNRAIGISTNLSAEEVSLKGRRMTETLKRILLGAVEAIPRKRSCHCSESLEGARV